VITSVIISLVVIAKYIAPTFQKKYNAIITDEELILENIETRPIKVKIKTIESIDSDEKNAIFIKGTNGDTKYEYNIVLDSEDLEVFMNNVNERINMYRNKIKFEIDRAVKLRT